MKTQPFQVKHLLLPHDGVISGVRGHKKQVPKGTKVYCIVRGTLIYWRAYLIEEQAIKAMEGLQRTVGGKINWHTLNFRDAIPKRIVANQQ